MKKLPFKDILCALGLYLLYNWVLFEMFCWFYTFGKTKVTSFCSVLKWKYYAQAKYRFSINSVMAIIKQKQSSVSSILVKWEGSFCIPLLIRGVEVVQGIQEQALWMRQENNCRQVGFPYCLPNIDLVPQWRALHMLYGFSCFHL